MRLYFLRHSHAIDHGIKEDSERELTADGIKTAKQGAQVFSKLHSQPLTLYTSPRLRAKQTAEIFAHKLKVEPIVSEECNYGFDLNAVRRLLQLPHEDSVMFVGHEPYMSVTLRELTQGTCVMKRCGLARVDIVSDEPLYGELVWLLTPKTFEVLSE